MTRPFFREPGGGMQPSVCGVRVEIGLQVEVLVFLESQHGGLGDAEAEAVEETEVGHLARVDGAPQFADAVARDVLVHVVVALRAQALQHEVAVEADEPAEAVAVEVAIGIGLLLLHHIFHCVEAVLVGLVEVVLRSLHQFALRRTFLHRDEFGVADGVEHGAQDAERERKVDNHESHLIDDEAHGIEAQREHDEVERGEAQQRAVEHEVVALLELAHQAARQYEDVDDVVERQQHGAQAQQHVARKEVLTDVPGLVDAGEVAAQKQPYEIGEYQRDGGRGVAPHAPPLQVSGHREAQRIDALEVGAHHEVEQHAGMQHAQRGCLKHGDEPQHGEVHRTKDEHDPGLRKVTHRAAREVEEHEAHEQMGDCRQLGDEQHDGVEHGGS